MDVELLQRIRSRREDNRTAAVMIDSDPSLYKSGQRAGYDKALADVIDIMQILETERTKEEQDE